MDYDADAACFSLPFYLKAGATFRLLLTPALTL